MSISDRIEQLAAREVLRGRMSKAKGARMIDVDAHTRTSSSGKVVHVNSYKRPAVIQALLSLKSGQKLQLPDGRTIQLESRTWVIRDPDGKKVDAEATSIDDRGDRVKIADAAVRQAPNSSSNPFEQSLRLGGPARGESVRSGGPFDSTLKREEDGSLTMTPHWNKKGPQRNYDPTKDLSLPPDVRQEYLNSAPLSTGEKREGLTIGDAEDLAYSTLGELEVGEGLAFDTDAPIRNAAVTITRLGENRWDIEDERFGDEMESGPGDAAEAVSNLIAEMEGHLEDAGFDSRDFVEASDDDGIDDRDLVLDEDPFKDVRVTVSRYTDPDVDAKSGTWRQ